MPPAPASARAAGAARQKTTPKQGDGSGKKRGPVKSRMLHIRVTVAEEAALRAAAEARGMKVSSFMRFGALHVAGIPNAREFEVLGWPELIRHLDGAANNLNQLARAANRGRISMGTRDRIVMIELKRDVLEARSLFLAYREAAKTRSGTLVLPKRKRRKP